MEAIIGVLGAGLVAGLAWGVKVIGANLFLSKWGALIEKTYSVIDPIAGTLITGFEGSAVDKGIELAVLRVSDGELSDDDLSAIVRYVVDKFNPTIAATKSLDPSTEEGKASAEIVEAVKQLADGVTIDELTDIARKAAALV